MNLRETRYAVALGDGTRPQPALPGAATDVVAAKSPEAAACDWAEVHPDLFVVNRGESFAFARHLDVVVRPADDDAAQWTRVKVRAVLECVALDSDGVAW